MKLNYDTHPIEVLPEEILHNVPIEDITHFKPKSGDSEQDPMFLLAEYLEDKLDLDVQETNWSVSNIVVSMSTYDKIIRYMGRWAKMALLKRDALYRLDREWAMYTLMQSPVASDSEGIEDNVI